MKPTNKLLTNTTNCLPLLPTLPYKLPHALGFTFFLKQQKFDKLSNQIIDFDDSTGEASGEPDILGQSIKTNDAVIVIKQVQDIARSDGKIEKLKRRCNKDI